MQDMQLVQNSIVPLNRHQHTTQEIKEIVEKTGQFRMLGFTFANIGKALGISEAQACRHFEKWAKKHKADWDKESDKEFIRIRETFSKRLAESERNYESAKAEKNSPAMAAWHKLALDSLTEYVGFLRECGYLTPEFLNKFTQIETAKEPLAIIIEQTKKELSERIKIEFEKPNGNQALPQPS